MCRTLEVSKSGYYNRLRLGPSKRWLENQAISIAIHTIFKDSFESYGAPRIKRIARPMRANKLFARRRRKFIFTTDSDHSCQIAPNILNQDFKVDRENQQLWT